MFADLTDKIAIVTGSGQGIGAGIARVFAGAGAKVMVVNRTPENGQRTVDEIHEGGGEAELCGVDIGNVESVERAVEETVDKWSGVDIMLHNEASILGGPVYAFTEEDLRLLRLFVGMLAGALERTVTARELKRQSVCDRLTGLYNRRHFQERLAAEKQILTGAS